MMKIKDVLTPSFKELCRQLGFPQNLNPEVRNCQSCDSDFCRDVVARGWLTAEQMEHAAGRYRLGRSKSGRCIFWMIDEHGKVLDGHIGDSWVSVMMKARDHRLERNWPLCHCLFGQHLLQSPDDQDRTEGRIPVCIVMKESSAVILSELFPDSIWLATVYPMNFDVFSFRCLQDHDVTLFPPTDETMDTFLAWDELADQARRKYFSSGRCSVVVQDILEQQATPDQKARRIDLVDFLFESPPK